MDNWNLILAPTCAIAMGALAKKPAKEIQVKRMANGGWLVWWRR